MLWRQGDIYIESIATVPQTARALPEVVLADGEVTGHQHRIAEFGSAFVLEDRGQIYLDVVAERARVVHEEHGTIALDRGAYRVWRQREFDPLQQLLHRVVID
jgi:hypothetical protein